MRKPEVTSINRIQAFNEEETSKIFLTTLTTLTTKFPVDINKQLGSGIIYPRDELQNVEKLYFTFIGQIHAVFRSHGYLFSWENQPTPIAPLNWLEARKYCRDRCMELVSLETLDENEFVKEKIDSGEQNYAWTSGRKCDFQGCNRTDLLPIDINGWYWAGTLQKIPPTTDRFNTDWSDDGGLGYPQPDNREKLQGGSEESCIAILNNLHNDGLHWHDLVCDHQLPFICEDNDELLQIAGIPKPSSSESYIVNLLLEQNPEHPPETAVMIEIEQLAPDFYENVDEVGQEM
ncbi:uncharacterized protein LOC124594166 [Schistocerca americana]|uniref:uncharacterized protein LOC124594166 n=1 Tax=Schistocerca americana TaxID=7009 RepID=UPI001F4F8A43|nr:uncharacterized protein LOC124594166 [Schistocerca americana]